ncbi:ParB/RepB/Spo0J family partition protein [Mycobacteroides abscessus]|uniref:ParB/RepB/Spo0J family partition protein n=1 Tax=Mycobacteroides abscessus TaxID=36809 RepID=UPI0009A624B2|nr:ParB/RepB/Spo0J family partition protein [Mycobacteroides abscessus]SKT84957.1 ParB-like partition protein [Mycobacteroides abscessus subsp. massiliense]SKU05691.1 ParB-like partition protein [Mycobacteroides abscessus subsp. massiliense]
MSTGSTTVAKRTGRKAGERRTSARLARYAGGEESADLLEAAKSVDPAGGITAGLASIAAADGQKYLEAPTSAIAPHPFNPPVRSVPPTGVWTKDEDGLDIWRSDNPIREEGGKNTWAELVNSIRASGVQVPILLVTREAFIRARPSYASAIDNQAQYVVVYGHRRAAAAKVAGLETIPAVLDESVLDDGGDLDAMTIENFGREDLTPIQEAQVFERYSEAGLGQRAIAEKLGFDQSTVSRRMRLLLLLPEVVEGMDAKKIKVSEAVQLGTQLPYGPRRAWQQDEEYSPDQDSEDRRSDQLAAYELVLSGTTPKAAADKVRAERRARTRAAAEGIAIIDPKERFGLGYQRYAITTPADAAGDVVGAIDPVQGGLVYYPARVEGEPTSKPSSHTAQAKARAAASTARRAACARLVAAPPPRDKLLPLLAAQYAHGIAAIASAAAGWNLAFELSRTAGLGTANHATVSDYRAAASAETELKRQLEIAWACAVAGFELHAADKSRESWNHIDSTYLRLLQERAGYLPTPWENERLEVALDSRDRGGQKC